MKLDWKSINKPIIALSPMADMTDMPFCRLVKEVTGESDYPIMFREMVSSEAVIRESRRTMEMAEIHKDERPLVQQLFGADPIIMRDATQIINETYHPEGFDINMGCPVYKITSNFNGAALMKDANLASEIIKQMKSVIDVPLSVKIRLGWKDTDECLTFGPLIEQAGADLITMHGRTKEQGYQGTSDWKQIGELKKVLSIPLLANGDIHLPENVVEALEVTKADGVLIARGALGNPWFFKQAKEYINTGKYEKVDFDERIATVLKHFDYHIDHYGPMGARTFRKHLNWYFKGMENIKAYKLRLNTFNDREELVTIFDEIKSNVKVNI